MKKIIFVFVTVLFYSCNRHLDKSVFEPLTVEELKKSIDKDTLFEYTYKYIQHVKDSVLKSDIQKAKFADLTYRRVHNLVKFNNDTARFNPIRRKLRKEWEEKYGILHTKLDSISAYWKKYRDENSLEQYVKIELVSIDKEYYTYAYGIKDVRLGFRLTPLKGSIDQLKFGYEIEAKIDEKTEEDEYASIYSSLDKSWCLSTAPFSQPVIRYWEAGYKNEKILESRTVETLLRDYNINIEIDEIRKDGRNLSNDDLSIPESIKNHWRYENRDMLNDLYAGDVLKETLNIDYVPDYEYILVEVNKILKDKDELAFQFLAQQ